MVGTRFCFDYFYPFLFTQRSKYLADIFFNLTIYYHSAILGRKYYMILTSPCCMT